MINKTIYETGDGGSIYPYNNDILTSGSIFTEVYIALFGGNVEASTKSEKQAGVINNDWWGNSMIDDRSRWINSETEKVLMTATSTPRSVKDIKEAVEKDLKNVSNIKKSEVSVTFEMKDKVKISMTIEEDVKISHLEYIIKLTV